MWSRAPARRTQIKVGAKVLAPSALKANAETRGCSKPVGTQLVASHCYCVAVGMADQRYAERTGELRDGAPQPPEKEFVVAPNPGVATWASPAAGQPGLGPEARHYGGAWDQPGSTGSAGFADTTTAGEATHTCVAGV